MLDRECAFRNCAQYNYRSVNELISVRLAFLMFDYLAIFHQQNEAIISFENYSKQMNNLKCFWWFYFNSIRIMHIINRLFQRSTQSLKYKSIFIKYGCAIKAIPSPTNWLILQVNVLVFIFGCCYSLKLIRPSAIIWLMEEMIKTIVTKCIILFTPTAAAAAAADAADADDDRSLS